MNREEREEDKRLREILKKIRIEQPSYEWKIRNGKVERGSVVRKNYNLGDFIRGGREE